MAGRETQLELAADFYNRYPSEAVRLFVRPDRAAMPGEGSVMVTLPAGLKVEEFALIRSEPTSAMVVSEYEAQTTLRWHWAESDAPNEFVIQARVSPEAPACQLLCQAAQLDADGKLTSEAGLHVTVNRFASMLRYLPEIYTNDDFTNRFLMLIESFWKPIAQQIDHVPYYFDAQLTPPEFLAWLGSWFGLEVDENLSEENQRNIIAEIVPIFARKGTRQVLESFLRLYSGGAVTIQEHRDENLVLGEQTRLGYQIALGTNNRPHSFDVHIQMPQQTTDSRSAEEETLLREHFQRRIQALIERLKPAHTVYSLDIQYG